mgnify:FL=1
MQVLELIFTVDHRGRLKIPAPVLTKMGLAAGDHVRVAYLTHNGAANTFCELMLLPNAVDGVGLNGDNAIQIPMELMRQANIPQDADLQIACLDGCIVISRDTGLQPEELSSILDSLQLAESCASVLPEEARQVLSQLEQTIQNTRKGSE